MHCMGSEETQTPDTGRVRKWRQVVLDVYTVPMVNYIYHTHTRQCDQVQFL